MIPARSSNSTAPQPAPKLGELLVRRGCLTQAQCNQVLDEQRRTGRPFGEIAEAMFNLDPAALESAWADQYQAITGLIDPRRETTDVRVLSMISRRQAWQFRILPLRMDGAEVMICTAKEHLPRALRFAYSRFGPGCYFVLAEPEHLGQALERHYPMPGAREELAAWHAGRHAAGA